MKIGITGIANGGKTVFLTSLLWQLEEIESAEFVVSPKARFSGYKKLSPRGNSWQLFPFEQYRDSLVSGGQWPAKTTDSFRYSCEIRRKEWDKLNFSRLTRLKRLQITNRQQLDFFDFPGERVADAAIAAYESYADWSDHMLTHFNSHLDYAEFINPYLAKLDSLQEGAMSHNECEQVVVYNYKLALGGLIHAFKPMISPSTFLLTQDGDVASAVPKEELAETRYTGLGPDSQFAPLPLKVREAFPKLAKKMEKHYASYRKKVATPVFKELISSQRLVILVDIPSLLAGGVGRYNDNRQVLNDLFESIEPDGIIGSLFQKIWSFVGLGLEKVSFVAAKSDLMLHDDVNSGKVEGLLRQMTAKAKSMLPDVEFGYFVCSAVVSTRPGKTKDSLIASLDGNSEVELKVSPVPDLWPDSWNAGEFRFAEVSPKVSKNLMIPPKQLGLDRLFEFLIV